MSQVGDVKIRRKYKTPLLNSEMRLAKKKELLDMERQNRISKKKLDKEIEDVYSLFIF
jgi:hypothetical protein